MDVRCENCGSEYEFDESRIPAAGLPVKCSTCSHVFRVFPPGQELPGSLNPADWKVRQANGSVFAFRDLTTLQRWIVERKVSRHDEISKTGNQWRRLGDIAELATFFQVVEAAPQPMAGQQPAQPLPQQQPGQQPMTLGAPQEPQVAGSSGQPSQAAWEGTAQPLPESQSGPWQLQSEQDYDADATFDDDEFEYRRGGAGKWAAFLLLLLIVGGAAAVYFLRPDLVDRFLGTRVDAAVVAQVETGYKQLSRDSYAAIEQAFQTFTEAAKAAPEYPDALAGIAEAEMARAEYQREEAELLVASLAQLPEDERPAREAESKKLLLEATERGSRAFEAAKEAVTKEPDNLAGNRAMADYFRIMQAPERMQKRIAAARKLAPTDARLELVVGASLAQDAREAAISHLQKALAAKPDLQRARYRLVRVYVAAGEREKAATHLERLLSEVPDHERGLALKKQLEPEPEPVPEPVAEPEPEQPKVSFDGLMDQADRLRDSDRPGQALKLYERASDLSPREPDVYLGIGWCYIDLDQPAAAVSTFKTALRYAPRLSDAHMGLAEGYRMRGDNANAIKHYAKYLDIMPSGPEAHVARRMLKLLKKK